MSRFLFNMFNHTPTGQRSLEDVIGIIGHSLRALGHEAIWQTENHQWLAGGQGYNVVVEGFNDSVVSVIADAHRDGGRFLCVATEEPTPTGFNHGRDPEMAKRQDDFSKAAPYLDGILHLVPGAAITEWYAQYAPAAPIELGYAPSLVRKEMIPEPEFDFGFYGSVSKRRLDLLKKLAKRSGKTKAVRVVSDFATQTERDRMMQEAKVIIQIRKFDEMGLVSSSRCATALCLGRPVVAEPHELTDVWGNVVKFASTDAEFFDLAMITRSMWRGIHAGQFEKFKALLSPQRCIGDALEAIRVVGQRRTA